jgi:hypothetical protein
MMDSFNGCELGLSAGSKPIDGAACTTFELLHGIAESSLHFADSGLCPSAAFEPPVAQRPACHLLQGPSHLTPTAHDLVSVHESSFLHGHWPVTAYRPGA